MNEQNVEEIIEKIKELVKKGNIARILVKRDGDAFLNIPLNVGLVGTILGLTAAPWALIASAVATLGLDCKIELVKTNGEVVEVLSREVGRKAVDFGSAFVNGVRDSWQEQAPADEPADENDLDVPFEDKDEDQ